MYKLRIICPGRTKAKFIKDGINHYTKLLTPYAKVELIELKEGHGKADKVIEEESKQILNSVKGNFILLHREGQKLDSLEFARLIKDKATHEFVIGGVYGVSEEVIKSAYFKLSLSYLTFTHEISRLLLLEQLYRAMTIIHGKSYHY
ncbi:23S rRNA (pseudouridine(1915)-N(3))-methyltransferase RlmH [Thermodesulfovibrio sp. 3907-1M]|uniref:Ribosomal RNA large subunit methyltransferase H n=1 Tax=Thermodesulfovibrio autotrophicus TaxID=3118333 RepID=A0AAU8GXV9_9BACT